MKRIVLSLLLGALALAMSATGYRTPEYRQLQEKLCSGWNTWYNHNLISYTHLPENFAINLGLATSGDENCLREVYKKSDYFGQPEHVFPGLRSDDGAYTSVHITYFGIDVTVESAIDGDDQLVLVTPANPTKHMLIIEAGLLYDQDGMVGRAGSALKAISKDKEFVVSATLDPIPSEYLPTISPRLTCTLDKPIGIYTGKSRTLQEIQRKISSARSAVEARVASYGDLADSFSAMQTILAWNTIYDARYNRVITPVSRVWNRNWGGYVLFDWDTYFASYMLSLFNKDLAFANAVEITKSITPDGFIPNFASDGKLASSWDRSQPPVGSEIIWRIYQRYPERWFLEEVYDELLTWNRWWPENRLIDGYLAWGSHYVKDGEHISEWLQGAMYESGMDNSPMYDGVPMNPETYTMELADVGLNSMYIMDCKALAQIAGVLGKKDDVKELNARAKTFTKQLSKLWDEESGIFLNRRTDTGEFSHRVSPTNLYPMIAGACTQKQAERMMKDYYFNPEYFHGEFVIPSISRNDPAFGDNDYWRGRIWAPLNFLVYMGMQKYDVKDAREDMVQRSKALLMKNWKANGGIFENYNGATGQSDDVSNADSFYHWGALLTFMEFLETGRY